MKKSILFLLAITVATLGQAQINWQFDKVHSNIGFTVRHMVIAEVSGSFKDSDLKISTSSTDFNGATIEFVAKVGSIDTQNESRDGHLKGADFFDAAKFPEIKFVGKLVKKDVTYAAVGKLTLKDVTKDVSFPVEYLGTINAGKELRAGFKLSGSIKRFEYNLNWKNALQSGELVVADDVKLNANIELKQVK